MTKLERFKNGENVALHTPTEEIANRLMQWCDDNGILWYSGEKTVGNNSFHFYNQKTCYANGFARDKGLGYSQKRFYENEGYEVLELTLDDFKEDNKMFTKSDLKTGMVVDLANGNKYMVLTGNIKTPYDNMQEFILINNDGFEIGTNYDDLLCHVDKTYNIVAVYSPFLRGISYVMNDTNESTLIWKRKTEVDWSKIAIDTKVLVKDKEDEKWQRRYFAGLDDEGNTLVFNNGTTSFTRRSEKDTCNWDEMVLYEGNECLVGDDK